MKEYIDKEILDVTCGSRSIWYNKNHPLAVYCDKRKEEWYGEFGNDLRKDGTKKCRKLVIDPDVQCDFTDLPFDNNTFSLVVFDPPHIEGLGENSWTKKAYGSLEADWRSAIRCGFDECMRVLKPFGVLVFKWSETQIPTPEIIKTIGKQPLFGHRSGKKMNTNWLCFMKETPAADVVEVVRCKDCKHSKPIDTKQAPFRYYKPECLVCYCEEVVGDEPMVYYPTHFCSYGERIGESDG